MRDLEFFAVFFIHRHSFVVFSSAYDIRKNSLYSRLSACSIQMRVQLTWKTSLLSLPPPSSSLSSLSFFSSFSFCLHFFLFLCETILKEITKKITGTRVLAKKGNFNMSEKKITSNHLFLAVVAEKRPLSFFRWVFVRLPFKEFVLNNKWKHQFSWNTNTLAVQFVYLNELETFPNRSLNTIHRCRQVEYLWRSEISWNIWLKIGRVWSDREREREWERLRGANSV